MTTQGISLSNAASGSISTLNGPTRDSYTETISPQSGELYYVKNVLLGHIFEITDEAGDSNDDATIGTEVRIDSPTTDATQDELSFNTDKYSNTDQFTQSADNTFAFDHQSFFTVEEYVYPNETLELTVFAEMREADGSFSISGSYELRSYLVVEQII